MFEVINIIISFIRMFTFGSEHLSISSNGQNLSVLLLGGPIPTQKLSSKLDFAGNEMTNHIKQLKYIRGQTKKNALLNDLLT